MYATQKQAMESFVWVHAFPEAQPARGPLPYAAAQAMLDDARQRIGTHVGARAVLSVELRRARRAVDRLDAVVFCSDTSHRVPIWQQGDDCLIR